jgi:hypothetical protein
MSGEGSKRKSMKRRTRQYLKFQNWPPADKKLWKATFTPGTDLFDDDGGPGAHLAERTVSQLEYTYGKFLYFVSVKRTDLLHRNPAERIDSEVIKEFVNWQPTSCGAITLSIYLSHLWLALKYLCPRGEWQWLLAVSTRIKARGKAKPERHHLVTSDRLYRLGMDLMDGALSSGRPATSWRVQTAFRDGLAIALAAVIAPRRRTLAAVRIGKQLKKVGKLWFRDIPAEDVKTKRPLDYPISPELSRRIDIYLNEIRPCTAGANTHDYLWASARGRPMRAASSIMPSVGAPERRLGFPSICIGSVGRPVLFGRSKTQRTCAA